MTACYPAMRNPSVVTCVRRSTTRNTACASWKNHAEQRAAARFTAPEHHRGALLITGMVPGLLLCNHGQDDGRRLHASNHANRRPPEDGSSPHREAYRDLMHLLSEPARQHGTWHLLEATSPDSPLIGCLWTLQGHHALALVVNASWQPVQGAVQAGSLVERDCQLQQCFANAQAIQMKAETLRHHGLPVSLPPWGSVAYRVLPLR